ncbi:MAG TPA: diaminopimelate decarboxylase [Planctomycetota bacterium]|nr:diaminopimelate decarboxylase [Planctomycetota bacterium]
MADFTLSPAQRSLFLAAAKKFGTPLYLYDQQVIQDRCRRLQAAIPYPKLKLLYAMKANSNPAIIKTIHGEGFGIDSVSLGEVLLARKAGVPGRDILFTNNNVGDNELEGAAKAGATLNIDSLEVLARQPKGRRVFVRINGPVGAGHHDHCITGGPTSKFGVAWELIPEVLKTAQRRGVKIVGVHQHIGSGILDASRFFTAIDVLTQALRTHRFPDLEAIDFGGGIGIPYRPTENHVDLTALGKGIAGRFQEFCRHIGRELTLMIEPGRFLVAESGYLLSRATVIKPTPYDRTFAGIDTGFNHLVRPTMYGSYHHITNLSRPNGPEKTQLIAGNICETGDIFTRRDDNNGAEPRRLPEVYTGDILCFHCAGAYGFAMSSEYNTRPRPAEAILNGKKLTLIRKRKSFEQLVAEITK